MLHRRPAVPATNFSAIGCEHSILATDPGTLPEALAIALAELDRLDAAASRFRTDSEVHKIATAAAGGTVVASISETLTTYLEAALRMARLTDGLVDPTVGAAVRDLGYDADITEVRHQPRQRLARAGTVPGWRGVMLVPASRILRVPAGCLLDLGATAKALAADRIAEQLANQLPGGFLVNLGGDVAVSGCTPAKGWSVGVEAADGSELQVLRIDDAALATSSTRLRVWRDETGRSLHHIIDPRTGESADPVWDQVTCVATTALRANAASTAAIVLGEEAPAWLSLHGIQARLDARDGRVVRVGGWPEQDQ